MSIGIIGTSCTTFSDGTRKPLQLAISSYYKYYEQSKANPIRKNQHFFFSFHTKIYKVLSSKKTSLEHSCIAANNTTQRLLPSNGEKPKNHNQTIQLIKTQPKHYTAEIQNIAIKEATFSGIMEQPTLQPPKQLQYLVESNRT